MSNKSSNWLRDVLDPEWREREAAHAKKFLDAIPLAVTEGAQFKPSAGELVMKIAELEERLGIALSSRDFYKRRVEALQQWQSSMRDPERIIVCDIIANGCTLEPAGDRYKSKA